MRKLLLILLLLLAACGFWLINSGRDVTDLSTLPALESGDLIFETTFSNQTLAIMLATASPYTHVGIIHKTPQGISVIHAAHTVIESPLSEFVTYGWGQKITIERYPALTDAQREAIVTDARHYLGTPYNYLFYMPSPTLYCSELPYRVFSEQHLRLGTLEKIGDLHVNNAPVKAIFERRWHYHPLCQKEGMTYEACWKAVMNEPIITPASLARDPHLTTIYSNYPF